MKTTICIFVLLVVINVSLCQDSKEGLGEKNSKKVLKESPVVIIPRPEETTKKADEVAPVNFTQALQELIPKIAASFNNNSPKSSGTGRFHQRGLTRKNEQQLRQLEKDTKVEGEKAVVEPELHRSPKPIIPERPPYEEETFKKELTVSLQKYTENFYKNPANYDIKEKNGDQKVLFDGIIPDDAETLSKGDVALLWLEETLTDIREQYSFNPATKALLVDPKPTDRGETALIWLEQTLAEIREQYFDRVYEKQIKKLNTADKITRMDVLSNNLDASARQATPVGEELTAVAEEVPTEKTCGEFEEYNACGSPIFATCGVQPERRRGRAPRCIAGCFCKEGYVKLNGKCILSAECPVRPCLGSTEQYQECGTSCVLSCENFAKKNEIEAACPAICVRGCFCKPGMVRNYLGTCVIPSRCPTPLISSTTL